MNDLLEKTLATITDLINNLDDQENQGNREFFELNTASRNLKSHLETVIQNCKLG